jgi:gamma-aminobutyric acid type B receptor
MQYSEVDKRPASSRARWAIAFSCVHHLTGSRRQAIKDQRLLIVIGALLGIDCVAIALWVALDPMQRHVEELAERPSQDDVDLLYIPQLSKCHSQHLIKWLGAFYSYKGLLLLFGVYMAWETRHVKIPALNDSQYIGMNIYNVVLSSVTVVALSTLLTDEPTLSYTVVSALILLSTTGLLALLFLPKVKLYSSTAINSYFVVVDLCHPQA